MKGRLDLDRLRLDHPLAEVIAGSGVKLIAAGGELKGCCPLHQDSTPSLSIYDAGRKWICFAGCGGGDVFDYIGKLHGTDLLGAAAMLGAGELPTVEVAPQRQRDESDRTAEALAIWQAADPVEGTPAERYLQHRGITIPAPMSLRYAVLPYGRGGSEHPCLIACVSSPEGPLQGIQRTYLAADGRGKADVPAAKLSLGKVSGGAIRLAPLDDGEVIACAGVEDGLSLLQALGRPTWVAPGDSMLPAMRFPASVKRVAIGGDNDRSGREAANKAARTFNAAGVETRVFFPASAKDFNQALVTGGAR